MKKQPYAQRPVGLDSGNDLRKLEIVVKCDVAGTLEAVTASLAEISVPGVQVIVIQAGIGTVSKSDVLMAVTGSRLIVGFNVEVMPRLENEVQDHGVEVRLYQVIYTLIEDVGEIAGSLTAKPEPPDNVTGKGKVIATFKTGGKGIIIGFEILDGTFEQGKDFRVISAMGPVYTGKIESLQVEKTPVKSARAGQQAGLRIADWKKARIGDLVECFAFVQHQGQGTWKPKPGIRRRFK